MGEADRTALPSCRACRLRCMATTCHARVLPPGVSARSGRSSWSLQPHGSGRRAPLLPTPPPCTSQTPTDKGEGGIWSVLQEAPLYIYQQRKVQLGRGSGTALASPASHSQTRQQQQFTWMASGTLHPLRWLFTSCSARCCFASASLTSRSRMDCGFGSGRPSGTLRQAARSQQQDALELKKADAVALFSGG